MACGYQTMRSITTGSALKMRATGVAMTNAIVPSYCASGGTDNPQRISAS